MRLFDWITRRARVQMPADRPVEGEFGDVTARALRRAMQELDRRFDDAGGSQVAEDDSVA